ncbi:MAG TPA: hypothetical protein VES20_04355 [Bryobacteraceae bacterium]|nr:hypothetical protein [Bryobacteraceae bacterium]
MRRRLTAALVLVAAATALFVQRRVHAQSAGGQAFEFATVEAYGDDWVGNVKYSTANVCFHVTNGCRWETVRVSTDRWGEINDAFAAAGARLGERGWDLVAVTPVTDYQSQTATFRRARPASAQ